MSVKQHLARPF